jgi:threonyl-tRNA synthetase
VDGQYDYADTVVEKIRDLGISVAVDYTDKSIGDRIKRANTDSIPFFAVIGPVEAEKGSIQLKDLRSRKQTEHILDEEGIFALAKQISEAYSETETAQKPETPNK